MLLNKQNYKLKFYIWTRSLPKNKKRSKGCKEIGLPRSIRAKFK